MGCVMNINTYCYTLECEVHLCQHIISTTGSTGSGWNLNSHNVNSYNVNPQNVNSENVNCQNVNVLDYGTLQQ